MTLNAEITRRDCGRSRSQVFYALSSKPREHGDWRALRAARDAASCDISKVNR